jgi:VIT1/CCC1 family predicted Fe2+/Mn2+ transporter
MKWKPFAAHYIRDIVYAANDGLVTTFAVVAGVRGADLSPVAVLALGFANLAADGLSMAVGNYLGIKTERATELGADYNEWQETVHAVRHGGVTWTSFIVAGLIPLLPFFLRGNSRPEFGLSVALTLGGLFAVGASRTLISRQSWWRGGLEMLAVGSLAGGAAFLAGWLVSRAFHA